MKSKIYIQFPIKAISKDNEKIRNRQGFVFTTQKYKKFEQQVKFYAMAQYKGEVLSGDIEVNITFHFTSKVHCDLFNLPKSVCDALEGICYKNDKQIKRGTVEIKIDKELDTDCFEVEIKDLLTSNQRR